MILGGSAPLDPDKSAAVAASRGPRTEESQGLSRAQGALVPLEAAIVADLLEGSGGTGAPLGSPSRSAPSSLILVLNCWGWGSDLASKGPRALITMYYNGGGGSRARSEAWALRFAGLLK